MRAPAAAVLAIAASACTLVGGARLRGRGGDAGAPADARIVLYRDRALVDEEVIAEVKDGRATLPLPAGLDAAELAIASDDVHVRAWAAAAPDGQRDVIATDGARRQPGRLLGVDEHDVVVLEGGDVHVLRGSEALAGAVRPAVIADVDGRPGRARFRLRYPTDRLRWQASYTLVEDRGRGWLRGGISLDNQTGRRWRRAALTVIEGQAPAAGDPDLPVRRSRLPGRYAIDAGAQRLELALPARSLPLGATLVYDPVDPALVLTARQPEQSADYGMQRWPAILDETVKIDLAAISADPLPAGPVRLATAEPGGLLRWRGEGEVLRPSANSERSLTIAVGKAADVTGTRRRLDFVIDSARQRLFEEFAVTLTSTRATPVDVVVRERVYRGACWVLAYHSTGDRVAKEGDQQFAMTTTVPPGGTATVAYRVVYHWSDEVCSDHS